MKERPINLRAWEVSAIREGRKTQFRRVVKPQPFYIYRLTDERIAAIHTDDNSTERHCAQINSSLSELGLHGWERWTDLLKDQICRIWAEGARGLVCVEGAPKQKGIPFRFTLSREHEGDEERSQAGLHGIPRDASNQNNAGEALGRQPAEQRAAKSQVGNSGGELDGQRSSRAGNKGREAPRIKADRLREIRAKMGNLKGDLQPTSRWKGARDVAGLNISNSPWQVGQNLWVREATWWRFDGVDDNKFTGYVADGSPVRSGEHREATADQGPHYKVPSIHMPRWASRITLEVVSVRVERLNEISESDAIAEGVFFVPGAGMIQGHYLGGIYPRKGVRRTFPVPTQAYRSLWESDNGPGSWGDQWVWVEEYRVIKP